METIIALTEGGLDRAVVERMLAGHAHDAYPKPSAARQEGGKDAAIADAVRRVRVGQVRLVLGLDLNGGDETHLISAVTRAFADFKPACEGTTLRIGGSSVCVWPLGFRSDPTLLALGIRRHMVEDLLIKALHVPDCIDKVSRGRLTVDAWSTVAAMLAIARDRKHPCDASKDILRLFLVLLGFGASMATFGQKVIECAQGTEAEALFKRPDHFLIP